MNTEKDMAANSLNKENESLRDEIVILMKQRDKLQEDLKNAIFDSKKIDDDMLKLTRQRDKSMSIAQKRESQFHDSFNILVKQNNIIEHLQASIFSLREQLAGIDVNYLENQKRSLESQLVKQKAQIDQLEEKLQLSQDAYRSLQVNMQALKIQYDEDLQAKDVQLENERKIRTKAINRLERLIHQEDTNMRNTDAQRDAKEAKFSRDEAEAIANELETKMNNMKDKLNQNIESLNTSIVVTNSEVNNSICDDTILSVDARIQSLEEGLKAVQSTIEMHSKNAHIANLVDDLNRLELQNWRMYGEMMEEHVTVLAKQNIELKPKLKQFEELEKIQNETFTSLESLKNQFAEFQKKMNLESKQRSAQKKKLQGVEKNINQLISQMDDEKTYHDSYKEQVEKVKILRGQLNKAESEISMIKRINNDLCRENEYLKNTIRSIRLDTETQFNQANGQTSNCDCCDSIPNNSVEPQYNSFVNDDEEQCC